MRKIIKKLFGKEKKFYSIGRYTTSCPILLEMYRDRAMKELRQS